MFITDLRYASQCGPLQDDMFSDITSDTPTLVPVIFFNYSLDVLSFSNLFSRCPFERTVEIVFIRTSGSIHL
jgi:hypothetical protein